MTHFSRNIKALRDSLGISQQRLADSIGATQTAVAAWESRDVIPRPGTIRRICEVYGVTEQDLLGFSDGFYAKSSGLSGRIVAPGESFDNVAPVVGRIAAGDPNEVIELTGELHRVPDRLRERYPTGYFIVVRGDSMDKVIPDGAYAYIVPADALEACSGDVAAVKANGDEATIKRVKFFDGLVVLEPESSNPEYKRRVIDTDNPDAMDVRILGKVAWFDYDFVNF